jgi:hypothetical protein
MNFVHRQVLQISALDIYLRKVLFVYGAVCGSYMPSRLIKLLVPDKEVYEMLLMCFAKNEQRMLATLAWTMVIFNVEPAKKRTVHSERGRFTETTRNYSCTTRASAKNKSSAPSDADSDQKVKTEGLVQRTIGSENDDDQILAQIT